MEVDEQAVDEHRHNDHKDEVAPVKGRYWGITLEALGIMCPASPRAGLNIYNIKYINRE